MKQCRSCAKHLPAGLLGWLLVLALAAFAPQALAQKSGPAKGKQSEKKEKKEKDPLIISKKDFLEALQKLAKDERVPVASSTLVEKGRGEDFYNTEKMFDNNPETFWAEGSKDWGKNDWVVFHIPDGTTHVEISPGAGGEQFINFNRPKHIFLDIYFVKLKRTKEDEIEPTFKYLGRTEFKFKDEPKMVSKKLKVKLPEVVMAERVMYVGVLFIRDVYHGQFDDTAITEITLRSVWGEQ